MTRIKNPDFKSVLSVAKLTIVAYRLNWTTSHRFLAHRFFLIGLWLFVHERIIILIAAREVLRCGVATDIAIDARGVHVKRTADVLFHFVVLIRHAGIRRSGMRHLFRDHHRVKLIPGQITQLDG